MPHVQIIIEGEIKFDHHVVAITLRNHDPERWAEPERMAIECTVRPVNDV